MSGKKVYELSAASGLGLSVELSKLEEKRRKEKASHSKTLARPKKKALDKSQFHLSNRGVALRAKFDQPDSTTLSSLDDQDLLRASQLSLERKSKIYDKLSREAPEFDEMDEAQLIDFERKKMEGLKPPVEGSNKPSFKDDPWVELVDEFGRTRVVRQSEAKAFQKSDDETMSDIEVDVAVKREEERLEWERQRAEKNKGPIHYDANEEHRTRGVGFYKFSTIEEERKAQMEQLKQLREDTDRKRALQQSIKDKRKLQLEERIKKIQLLQSKHNPKLLYPPPLLATGSTRRVKGKCSTDLDLPLLTSEVNLFLNECKRLL